PASAEGASFWTAMVTVAAALTAAPSDTVKPKASSWPDASLVYVTVAVVGPAGVTGPSVPWDGPLAMAKESASPSGSEPFRVTSRAPPPRPTLTDWGSANGASFAT